MRGTCCHPSARDHGLHAGVPGIWLTKWGNRAKLDIMNSVVAQSPSPPVREAPPLGSPNPSARRRLPRNRRGETPGLGPSGKPYSASAVASMLAE